MRFAEERSFIACRCHGSRKALLPDGRVQIDAVVMHPVGAAQLPRQDRGARGLAHDRGRDAVREMCAVGGQLIQMRRLDRATFKAEAIGAVLVGGNQ